MSAQTKIAEVIDLNSRRKNPPAQLWTVQCKVCGFTWATSLPASGVHVVAAKCPECAEFGPSPA